MNSKKFNLKKTQKPKHIVANSDTKFLFYEEFINFLRNKYSNKLFSLKRFYKEKNTINKSFSKKKTIIKKFLLNTPILKEIFFKVDGSNILSQEYKLQKFPNLLRKEINQCLFYKSKPKKNLL